VAICPRLDLVSNPRTLFQEHDPGVPAQLIRSEIKQALNQSLNSLVTGEHSELAVMKVFRLGMLPLLIWQHRTGGIGILVRDIFLGYE
jgi:hypothetical protein